VVVVVAVVVVVEEEQDDADDLVGRSTPSPPQSLQTPTLIRRRRVRT
jgi:hypothetical protein